MEDSLLTKEEIEVINTESKKPKFKNENLIEFGFEKTSILRISQRTGLILFQGNLETGFEHIIYRHSPASKPGDWQMRNNQLRLNEPSKFSFSSTPIFDYLLIADSIYINNKKESSEENHSPDRFDFFTDNYQENCGKIRKFKLLLYKGTKIIHTLYPTKALTNKKKILNLIKGPTIVEQKSGSHVGSFHIYEIRYFDNNNICRAKLRITVSLATKIEDYIIEINDSSGKVIDSKVYETKIARIYDHPMDRAALLDFFENLSPIEKAINKLLNDYDNNQS